MVYYRWGLYLIGLFIFSLGVSITIKVQYLGLHPWDVLNVSLYKKVGLSIGTWNVIIGIALICITLLLDKSYIKLGTFFNTIAVGLFVDLFLWIDLLPSTTFSWIDILFMIIGIVLMGIGAGINNAAHVGSGPRDGLILSISNKLFVPIRRVRIIIESAILLIGLSLGGPVFVFSFIFTFIQSPLFQFFYLTFSKIMDKLELELENKSLKGKIG